MELPINKNTILTIMYTIVDDAMKSSPIIQATLTRPGPDPECPDSAIVTVSLYQELIGEPREDHFYRLHEKEIRSFFSHYSWYCHQQNSRQTTACSCWTGGLTSTKRTYD